MRSALIVLVGPIALGCAPGETWEPSEELRPLGALHRAVDLDPDPGVVEVELVAEVGLVELVPGVMTEVWAYRDGGAPAAEASIPGPLVEAHVGDRVIVHLRNALPQSTTVHWHGLRLPPAMDGNPMVGGAVEPDGGFEYEFVVRDPGLHWYHPHVHTDEQVQRGLQGPLLVRGDAEPEVDTERVLVLDDVELDDDGAIVLDLDHDDVLFGRRGNVLLVNGQVPGHASARGGTIERWRVVNTSNGRFFALALADHPLRVIGWDGGPVLEPYDVDALVVAPGERFDVLVALRGEAGDALVLETLPYDRGGGHDDGGPFTLLTLDLHDPVAPPAELPVPSTPAITPLVVEPSTPIERFELRHETGDGVGATYFINDQRWPFNGPLEVTQGEVAVWELVNLGEHDHPFHLHGMFFQVLDRDGVPEPTLGWKDTVRVSPRGTTRFVVRYETAGMWMYHCTIPEHAERGMMGDLRVERR